MFRSGKIGGQQTRSTRSLRKNLCSLSNSAYHLRASLSADKRCQLRWSMQHLRAVYSLEFRIPMSFWVADSSAARRGRAALAKNQTGRCLAGSIAAEQIGVFVAAALPGTLWIAEVDLHIRGYRKLLVLGHLQTAIPGQRTF